ncbi:hypothetical protein TI03_05680, partial [Achromatium sp. WMS1]
MQISVHSSEELKRRITIELSQDDIDQETERRLKKLIETGYVDGFSSGQSSEKAIRKRYTAKIQREVHYDLVQSNTDKITNDKCWRVIGKPIIDYQVRLTDQGQKVFCYNVDVEIYPDIPNVPVNGYVIQRPILKITNTDVDEIIYSIREEYRTWKDAGHRTVQLKDRVLVSFNKDEFFDSPIHRKDGPDLSKNVNIIVGSSGLHPQFDTGLIGMSINENRIIKIPNHMRSSFDRSNYTSFDVTVKKIWQPIVPKLNANFLRKLGMESGNVDLFKKLIR